MAEKAEVGCARPTGGPVGEAPPEEMNEKTTQTKEERKMIMVGQKADVPVALLIDLDEQVGLHRLNENLVGACGCDRGECHGQAHESGVEELHLTTSPRLLY